MNFCASRARARTADLGVQFLCFWVILGIASRSSFGIFAIGGASDELQFHACSDTCTRARIDVLDGIFQYFIGIQFFGGSAERIINSRLNQPFQNNLIKTDFHCRAFWISMPLIDAVVSDKSHIIVFFLLSWWFSNIFTFTTWWCWKISTVDFTVLKNFHCCHGGIWRWVFLAHSAI